MAAGEPVKELAQPDKGACLDNRIEPSSDDDSTAVKDVKADAPEEEMKVSYGKLYSQADNFDTILMALGAVGSVANGAAFPMFAIVFGQFTDVFGSAGGSLDMEKVSQLALYFVYIAIASGVAAYFQGAMWMWTGHRQTAKLRNLYLSAVLRQDVAFFDTQATTGSLLKGLDEDSASVQQAISEKVGHFMQHVSCFLIGYIVAFWRGWDMTLVMLGTLPFLALVGMILSKLTTLTTTKTEAAYTKASSHAQQAISQIRTVAAYHGEERSIQEYEKALEEPIKVGIQQALVAGVCNGGIHAIVYWTYAVAFIYGAWRVSTGAYTGGDVMNVLVAALVGGFSAGQASPTLATFAKGRVAGAKLYSVIERCPAIDVDSDEGIKPEKISGELELRNVCFSYPARRDMQVFNNFSLMIPAGKTVALVGSSGSGKSTAVQLIERFYDPDSGEVLLDGIDLRQLNLHWLRSNVGLVSQEPTLFATTIFENIAMGRNGATAEEVKAAAEAANAHRFIANLPHQYDTQVGERGLSLSGGQKQRIAIARAILKNPRILLLDEATSALDTESERIVQDALNRMIVGRTTVVVAHRLSTIKDADIIAVVSKGEVIEQGNHQALIANESGHYTTLVKLQMKEEMEKGGLEKTDTAVPDPDAVLIEEDVDGEEEAARGDGKAAGAGKRGSKELAMSPAGSGQLPASVGVAVGGRRVSAEAAAMRRGGSAAAVDIEAAIPEANKDKQGGKDKKEKQASVGFSRLLEYNRPEWYFFILGGIGAAAAGVVQPAFAFVISAMINTFYLTAKSDIMSAASFLCWMFFAIGGGTLIACLTMHWAFGICGQWLSYRLRNQLFRNIIYQEIGWFDMAENSSGILTTRLAADASQVRGAVGDTLALMVQNGFCLAFGLLVAFVFEWRMALVVIAVLPVMIAGSLIYYKTMSGGIGSSSVMFTNANQAVSDAFSSIRIIHAYTLRQNVCELYGRLVGTIDKDMVKNSNIMGATQAFSQFTMFVVYGLIVWFGGLEVSSGRATFEEMLKAFLAILLAAMGLAQSSIGFPDVGKAKQAIANVFPLVDRKSLIDASKQEGIIPDEGIKGEIELRNVKFVYPSRPSVVVFNNFNLRIPAGKTVALVGESGSGKSTIVGLVERFYDVLEGCVLLDGVDIRQYRLSWLRQQIGIVSQEPLLFSTSILDNIRFGKPDAPMEEVEAAARAANAYDFIMTLPDGFNTLVGERGMQLSGGQKQRVAIARAVIKQPRVMLLDEATSALDAKAEREVQEALDQIMIGRTSIVVAHRLSTIRNADLIALVFRGSILEQGTHDELMALPDGGYKRLVAAQMGGSAAAKSRVQSKANLAGQDRSSPTK